MRFLGFWLATLGVLASLKTALGDLDRVSAWLMVNGYVNAEPGYPHTTAVMNPCSELIVDRYGADTGSHARTAIGVAAVPLNLPVVIRRNRDRHAQTGARTGREVAMDAEAVPLALALGVMKTLRCEYGLQPARSATPPGRDKDVS